MRLLFLLLLLSSFLLPSFSSTLTTAISKGETDKAIKILLRDPKQVNIADADGNFPIHLAVYNDDLALLEAIINADANLDIHNSNSSTALLLALHFGNSDSAKFLIEHGADVLARDEAGQGALGNYIDTDTAELLIEKGALVNIADYSGVTPLMRAMMNNDVAMVKILATHGADFTRRDNANKTLLHYAAASGNLYLVMMTVAKKGGAGSDLDDFGASPLHDLYGDAYAEDESDRKVAAEEFEDTLALFNEVQLAELHKELGEKIADPYIAISRILIKRGAELNKKDENGNTPFMLAASSGRLDLVRFLDSQGADLNVRNDDGDTVLFNAIASANLKLLRYLVGKGCSTEVKNKEGDTLLHRAVMYDANSIVDYLLSENAKVDAANKYGQTALMLTLMYNEDNEMVNSLLENGADLALQDPNGNDALHLAAIVNNSEGAATLLEQGAKWDVKNMRGQTAIDIALANDATDTLKVICKSAGVPVPKKKK